MSALQMELDTSRNFSTCFSGGGDVAEIDKPVGYFQHGLYFGHDKKLLVDHPYNAQKLALMRQLGLNPDEPKPEVPVEQMEERKPLNPDVVKELESRSDAMLTEAGAKLVAALAADGQQVEAPAERDALIRFIAEHVS